MKRDSVYSQLIDITEDYLGPSAERFIDRQIESHLQKKPETITKKDLTTLNDWIIAVVALLTESEDVISEYSSRLDSLTKKHIPKK